MRHYAFEVFKIHVNCSVGRMIVTKAPGMIDDRGSADAEDVTDSYKPKENSFTERLAVYNAVDGSDLARRYYYSSPEESHDVYMELVELDKVKYGKPYKVRIILEVKRKRLHIL